MVAMTTETNQSVRRRGVSFPGTAFGAAVGSAVAFGAVAAVTRHQGGNDIGLLIGAGVMALSALLLVLPITRGWALLLAWNGLGIGVALLLIGIFSVGALAIFPLVLVALTLSSWPRREGESMVNLPALVVQVSGFVLVLLVYGVLNDSVADVRRWLGW